MQKIKTLVVLLVLAGVGYGVHVIMNKPPTEMPVEVAGQTEDDWHVNVNMGGLPSPGTPTGSTLSRPEPLPSSVSEKPLQSGFPEQAVSAEGPSSLMSDDRISARTDGRSSDHAEADHHHPGHHDSEPHGSLGVDPFDAAWAEVVRNLESNDLATALFTLTPLVDNPDLNSQQAAQVRTLADQLAGTVIYSREYPLEASYVVSQGETLEMIAQRYKVSAEFLARVNGIASTNRTTNGEPLYMFSPGTSLKVVTGPFTAQLNRDRGEMVIYLQRYYAGRFAISLGPDAPATTGMHRVTEMQPGRAFFAQGHEVPASDPRNPYGRHWIGLGGSVGIHGMPLTESNLSGGSIAMTPADVADAYILFTRDTRVTVR